MKRPGRILPTIANANTLLNTLDSIYSLHRSPLEAPSFPPFPRRDPGEGWGRQSGDQGEAAGSLDGSANTSPLCRRCRRPTSERQDFGVDKSCEECKNDPELAHVAQKAALALSQLAATLSSGVCSDQRAAIGIIGVSDRGFIQPSQILAIRQTPSPRCTWVHS